jgi:hypothetical protein
LDKLESNGGFANTAGSEHDYLVGLH